MTHGAERKERNSTEEICLDFNQELNKCFPHLPETVNQCPNNFLLRFLENIESISLGLHLVGSVQRRVVEDLDDEKLLFAGGARIAAVQRRFQELYYEALNIVSENSYLVDALPSLKKLAEGADDLDFKVKKAEEVITTQDRTSFREIFFDTGKRIIEESGEFKIEKLGDEQRDGFLAQREDFEIEFSYGPVSTNTVRNIAQIIFRQNDSDVLAVHVGFYPVALQSTQLDRRAGGKKIPRKQQGEIPLEVKENKLVLKVKNPQEEIKSLADPDDFITQEIPEVALPLEGDLEILMRTIRVALFHHNEKKLQEGDGVYSVLFSQNLWQWMEEVAKKAIEVYSQSPPSLQFERRLTEMMMLRLEADPYLTLLIADKIGLMNIFPFFHGQSVCSFLTSDNFAFIEEGEESVPFEQRDMRWILQQRERFLKSGASGLKIFYGALKGKKPVGDRIKIKPEEFVDLMEFFSFNQALLIAKQHLGGRFRKFFLETAFDHAKGAVKLLKENVPAESLSDIVDSAAYLHDMIEDGGVSADQLSLWFSLEVIELVKSVTEDKNITDYRERKRLYLDKLGQSSDEALLISTADKIHNLLSEIEALRQLREKIGDPYALWIFWSTFNGGWIERWEFYQNHLALVKGRLGENNNYQKFLNLYEQTLVNWQSSLTSPEEYKTREIENELSVVLREQCLDFCHKVNPYLRGTYGVEVIPTASVALETAVYKTKRGLYLHDIDFLVFREDFAPVDRPLIEKLWKDLEFVQTVNNFLKEIKIWVAKQKISIGLPFEADLIGLPKKGTSPAIVAINNRTEEQIHRGF